jgi:hypothetical protein
MQRPADLQAAMSLARAFERRAGAVAGVSSLTGGRSTALINCEHINHTGADDQLAVAQVPTPFSR